MAKGYYTPINNKLFDELPKLEGLTGSDMRVLLCIVRNTICYHTDAWSMSLSFIVKGTNLSKRQIQRSLQKLSDSDLIEIIPAHGTTSQIVKIRGDRIGLQSGQSWSDRVDKTGQKRANPVHQETKEEIKDKEIKEEEKASPTFSSEEEWRAWMETQDVEED